MEMQKVIHERRSVNVFNPSGKITTEEIEKILNFAIYAPSSYNLQHWHFLVITDNEQKLILKKVAFGQQKIEDAAAAIVVLGDLIAHERAETIANDLVLKGYLPSANKDFLINKIHTTYSNKQNQRDEAIRSSSMAAMNLMLAAKDLNYGTCPMINFDPDELRIEFNIPDHLIPVMIITIGPENVEERPRKMRLSIDQVTKYNKF
jgi:putative NAD(P)H nitroreductase